MMLYLAVLCVTLAYRFFTVKAKLPVLGLRGGLGRLTGKRRRLAVLGVLFFLARPLISMMASSGRLLILGRPLCPPMPRETKIVLLARRYSPPLY